MIAASEEFLNEIAPVIRRDGELDATHMVVAALDAGTRFDAMGDGTPYVFDTTSRTPFYLAIYMSDLPRRGGGDPEYSLRKIRDAVATGVPFVGWSINAESRRIDGPAQPGEGDFIKYLGRDPAPEEIGPCSFDRE